jgi:hypothetical protein
MSWDYLRVSMSDTIDARFNVTHQEWHGFLQRLKSERWELETVDKQEDGYNESHWLKQANG